MPSKIPNHSIPVDFHRRTAASVTLGLMAKYWTPDTVKTRLGATVGMQAAARIHHLFVSHLVESLSDTSNSAKPDTKLGDEFQLQAVIAPAEHRQAFADAIPPRWQTALQSDGDLGKRMQQWFCTALESDDIGKAILIGADCPTIDGQVIREAAGHLDQHDLVLGPARDGGYYLIAIRGPWRSEYGDLFRELPWSTDQVLSITRERATAAGLSLCLLDNREDIDDIDSLNRLRASWTKVESGSPHVLLRQQIDSILGKHE